jgi:hypothetical protein
MNRVRSFLLVCSALPVAALACGVCVEDKVAATYDHAVVARAIADRRVVVFAAITGQADGRTLAAVARRATSGVPGVERGSVRVAVDPIAISFALDPRVSTAERALAAIERRAANPGWKLVLLRVIE